MELIMSARSWWWKLQGLQQHSAMTLTEWATAVLSGVAAQSQESLTMNCSSCCTRDVVMTLWGGLATLVALSVDAWGCTAYVPILWRRFAMVILVGPLMPFIDLLALLDDASHSEHLMNSVGEEEKEAAKIIARCVVAVSVSPETHQKLPARTSYAAISVLNWISSIIMKEGEGVIKPASSLEIGTPADDSRIIILNTVGKAALLRAGLVRNLQNLQLLEAYSDVSLIISTVQAAGYMVAVHVRLRQHVAVSPVEEIALLLCGVVLLKCILHKFVRTTHHPLLLHLNSADQDIFTENCKHFADQRDVRRPAILIRLLPWFIYAIFGALFVAGISFSVYFKLAGSQLKPASLFTAGVFGQMFWWGLVELIYLPFRDSRPVRQCVTEFSVSDTLLSWVTGCLFVLCMALSLISSLFSVIDTVRFWHERGYDVRTSIFSQIIPHIG